MAEYLKLMAIVIYIIYGEVFTLTMENRDGFLLGKQSDKESLLWNSASLDW